MGVQRFHLVLNSNSSLYHPCQESEEGGSRGQRSGKDLGYSGYGSWVLDLPLSEGKQLEGFMHSNCIVKFTF